MMFKDEHSVITWHIDRNDFEAAERELKNGISPYTRDRGGRNAFDWAMKTSDPDRWLDLLRPYRYQEPEENREVKNIELLKLRIQAFELDFELGEQLIDFQVLPLATLQTANLFLPLIPPPLRKRVRVWVMGDYELEDIEIYLSTATASGSRILSATIYDDRDVTLFVSPAPDGLVKHRLIEEVTIENDPRIIEFFSVYFPEANYIPSPKKRSMFY